VNAGNSRWVTAMEWSGQIEYVKANWKEFEVDGVEAGLTTGYGPLQFLKVCLLISEGSSLFLPLLYVLLS